MENKNKRIKEKSDLMIEKIKQKYLNNRKEVKNWDKSNKANLEQLKNGVYAFYKDKDLLYIGMVSDAKTASLYARMYANGNSKHCGKSWFEEVNKVFFYKMNTEDKFDIQVLERILIRELKPVHNDLEFDDNEIQAVFNKM